MRFMSPRPSFLTRFAPNLLILLFSLFLGAAPLCAQHWNLEETLVITDVNVVDVRTGEVRPDQVVVIERNRITTVGSKGTRYLGQPRKQRRIFQPQFVIDGGSAAHQRSCRNIVRDPALRRDDGSFPDLAMSDDSNLPC